jgi:carboxymethylenebutenolidase
MKIFKRFLAWIGIILAATILFFPISIFIDSLLGANRLDTLANTTISGTNGSPAVRAYVAKPEGAGPFPTVIMIHDFYGLSDKLISKADLLAQEGYLVVAADTYRGASTGWIPRAIYLVATADQTRINADLDSVFAWIASQPNADIERVGILGFCYGGKVSLQYSLHNNNLSATVIFYGSPEANPEILKNLSGPVLGIYGSADQSIPLTEVNAFKQGLEAAAVPHQISIYEGQPHAFVVDANGIKTGGAQGQAWNEMLQFLEVNLKSTPSSRNGNAIEYAAPINWHYYFMLAYEHAFGTAGHLH